MLSKRKQLELNIINNLEKPELEEALGIAWQSGLFTYDEMKVIVEGSEVYKQSPDKSKKTEAYNNLAKKIGAITALVLLNLIQQANMDIDFFYVAKGSILKNCRVNASQLAIIITDLVSYNLIEKRINRGLWVKINWHKLSAA